MNKFLLTACTFLLSIISFAQGIESFNNMPANASNYTIRTWTGDNGRTWTADSARTDQTLNGRALAYKSSPARVVCNGIPNGCGLVTFSYQQVFTTPGAMLELLINGNSIGSVAATTTVQTATFNNINAVGAFNLEIRNTATTFNARVLIDDITWTAFSGQPCATPMAQPASLIFGTVTNTSISGSFSASSPAANEYLMVISTSNNLTALPQNGNIYSQGDVIGNGTVVSRSFSTSFTASSLSSGTTYYFYVFAVNSTCTGGPLYNIISPLTGNVATTTPPVCASPSTSPGTLALNSAGTSVSGSFSAAAGADGYLVIRSISSTLGFTPVNGTLYTVNQSAGSGIIIKYGPGTSFSAAGLTTNTAYYFYVFAVSNFNCTGGPLYNTTSSNGVATTTANASGEPIGYYTTTTGLACEVMKDTLSRIITRGYSQQSYNSLWDHFPSTDKRLNDAGTQVIVWDMYSDNPTGTEPYEFIYGPVFQDNGTGGGAEGQKYNREHSWPNSWFGGVENSPMYSDLYHLYPTDKYVNNLRSSYPYGETSTPTNTTLNGSKLGPSTFAGISGTVFEPINEYKGDLARTYFYMATRYHSVIAGWENFTSFGDVVMDGTSFPSFEVDYLRLLLKWHSQDPVSQKEIDRNNAIFAIQKNRNPFIDHPEYVNIIWNSSCAGLGTLPVDIISFSGKLVGDKIMLEWVAENEANLDRFEIERSINGSTYFKIGEVKAANLHNYTFNDDALRGQRVYYRLKKIDKDARFKYSAVFSLHVPLNTKFTVYPNPASTYIQLQMNRNVAGNVAIQLSDISGKVLQQQTVTVNGSNIQLNTSALSTGTYLVKLTYNGEQYIQKVMVIK